MQGSAAEGQAVLDSLRSLIISYLGLLVQTPDMFPAHTKPNGKTIDALCLLPSIVRTAQSSSLGAYGSSSSSAARVGSINDWAAVDVHETSALLNDLVTRFGEGGDFEELQEILAPVFEEISKRVLVGEQDDTTKQTNGSGSTSSGTGGAPSIGQLSPEALAQAAQTGNVQAVLAHLLGQRGAAGMPGANNQMDVDEEEDEFADIPGGALRLNKPQEGPNIAGLDWRPYVNALVEAADSKKVAEFVSRDTNLWVHIG